MDAELKKVNDEILSKYYMNEEEYNEIVEYCKTNNKYKLFPALGCNPYSLFLMIEPGKTVLEYMAEHNLLDGSESYIGFDLNAEQTQIVVDTAVKYNKLNILKYLHGYSCFYELNNGQCVFDLLLENNLIDEQVLNHFLGYEGYIVERFLEAKKYNLLCERTKYLAFVLPDGSLVLDKIMSLPPDQVKELFKELQFLLSIDTIRSTENCSKILIKLAKAGMYQYIPKYGVKELLESNLLVNLLNEDAETTIKYILDKEIARTPSILAILKHYGISNGITLPAEPDGSDILSPLVNGYNNIQIEEEQQRVLNTLRDLFYNDGISNITYVNGMIASYKIYLSCNPQLAMREMELLI